jgi:hypothetical protein
MTVLTFSLEQVAAEHLPEHWTDSVRWLARRLNRGELSGYRVGRTWRMTEADVDYMIAKHHNACRPLVASAPDDHLPSAGAQVSFLDGLSDRSRSRLRQRSA